MTSGMSGDPGGAATPMTSAAVRSVPSHPDRAATPPAPAERPELVAVTGDAVGFLDAPGLDITALCDAVDGVLAGMPDGAILTVFTDAPAAAAAADDWCLGRGIELLAIIRHERAGVTLTLRRVDSPTRGAPAPEPAPAP